MKYAAVLLIGQHSWMETEIRTNWWMVAVVAVLVALCVFFLWLRRRGAKKRLAEEITGNG